jgi:hypothetical protein
MQQLLECTLVISCCSCTDYTQMYVANPVFSLLLLLPWCCQVEVLHEQLAAAQEQLRAAKATAEEQQRQLADSKLALTGARSSTRLGF